MTGLSTQTLHAWMGELMRPIPDIHLGVAGSHPPTLEQAVLRVMGEDPHRDWTPDAARDRIPPEWPGASADDVGTAMEQLARWHMIWDGESGYRVAPPTDSDVDPFGRE
jgi:hypothetical protein